jgi:hypothetical protein
MADKNKILKVVILDDELDDGLIYMNAYQNLVDFNQPKKENVKTFNEISPFLEAAQTANFIFIDFGMVGNFTNGNLYDAYSRLFKFAEEHPSKTITFVLTMPWNYYKDYDIFQLPNIEHFDISDSNWKIANMTVQWLFDNAVHDLFTKEWRNLQEQGKYIPKLKKEDAVSIFRYLYNDSSASGRKGVEWYREMIGDWYKKEWGRRYEKTIKKLKGKKYD